MTAPAPRVVLVAAHSTHAFNAPVAAPRMHHQALPDSIRVEQGGFTRTTLDSLRARGHAIEEGGRWGDVEAIIRTPNGWQGVSDPRRGGGGAGY